MEVEFDHIDRAGVLTNGVEQCLARQWVIKGRLSEGDLKIGVDSQTQESAASLGPGSSTSGIWAPPALFWGFSPNVGEYSTRSPRRLLV